MTGKNVTVFKNRGVNTVWTIILYLTKCKMTLIEENSPKNMSAKGKCIYPNIRWPPKK